MGVSWESFVESDLDLCALTMTKKGHVIDACYYNKLTALDGAFTHSGDQKSQPNAAGTESITVKSLATLPPEVHSIIFCLSSVNRLLDRVTYETAKFSLVGQDGVELTPSFLIAEKEGMVMGGYSNHMSLLATCIRGEEPGTWAMNVTPVANCSSGENFMDKTLQEFRLTVGITKEQCKAISKDPQPTFEFTKVVDANYIEDEKPLYVNVDARKTNANAQVTLNWHNNKYDYDLGCICLDNQGNVVHVINTVTEDWSNDTGVVYASGTSSKHDRLEFKGLEADLVMFSGKGVRTEDGDVAILEKMAETISIKFNNLPETVDALYFTACLYTGPSTEAIDTVNEDTQDEVFAKPEVVIGRWESRIHTKPKKPQWEEDGESPIHKFPIKFTPGFRSIVAVALYRNKFSKDKWHLDLPGRMGKGLVTSEQVQACQELFATFRNKGHLPTAWSPKQTPAPKSIKVTLKGATGIRAMDLNAKADPYVVVHHDTQEGKKAELFKTKPHKKTLEPIWDETFEVDPTQIGKLQFTVWDKDFIGSDEEIGKAWCILPLHQISTEPKTVQITMSPYKAKDGTMKSSGVLTVAFEGVY